MIIKIQEILNRFINEESIHSFIKNKYWTDKIIAGSIREQESASDTFTESMVMDFRYEIESVAGYDEQTVRQMLQEFPVEKEDGKPLTYEDLDKPEDIFDYMDEDQISETSPYKEFVKETLESRLTDIYDDITSKIRSGKLRIYREIQLDKENYIQHLQKEGKHLGIFWTTDYKKAEAYWGRGGTSYLFDVEVDEKNVNWYETFFVRLDLTLGEMEEEIRLFKGTPLKLISLEEGGKEVDISEIRDKTFYA